MASSNGLGFGAFTIPAMVSGSRTPDNGQEQPKPAAVTPRRPEPAARLA
jgi:hypothetical protein